MVVKKIAVLIVVALVAVGLAPRLSSAATPSVAVSDQVVMDHYVVIAKIVAEKDGWIVIHATDKDGTVLGYEAVKAGENDNVEVQIDLGKATSTVSAMLHIDAGKIGTYEFPGADTPVSVDGKVVNTAFKVIGVDVDDQFAKGNKEVAINAVIAQQDGWIVIHANDKDGTVLGYAPIKAGRTENIKVPLTDASKVTEMLTAMIHIDAGKIGTYEFPGVDTPPQLGGAIANEPLWTVDHVRIDDQKLAADGTLTVPYVLASVDGWIVIHATDKNGTVLGHAPIKKGLNEGVKVTIDDPTKMTDKVSAMLHIDAGKIGTYEFPGADAPVLGSDGKPVSPLFSTTGAEAMAATMSATMGMGDMSATAAATKAPALPAATPAATKST